MSRLTRKEMKRDEVLDWVGRSIEFSRRNARSLIGIGIAAVAVAGIVAVMVSYRGRQSERANTMLAKALTISTARIDALNPAPDDPSDPTFADEESRNSRARPMLEALHKEFKGKRMGALAAAHLGDLAASSGNHEEAAALWREALPELAGTLLAGRLQMNLLNLVKSQGNGESVVEELRGLMNSSDSPLPEDVVLYELGKALKELGRTDEARGAYERLIEEHDGSAYLSEARSELLDL